MAHYTHLFRLGLLNIELLDHRLIQIVLEFLYEFLSPHWTRYKEKQRKSIRLAPGIHSSVHGDKVSERKKITFFSDPDI